MWQVAARMRIMCGMRINLVTPFAEKDAVKALGARWDPAKKIWYINDVADLTPFQRWIPDLKAATDPVAASGDSAPAAMRKTPSPTPRKQTALEVPHCGCPVLPWEPCAHSPTPR